MNAKIHKRIFETVLFAMLGTLMFLGDLLMELFPNVHFVGVLCVTYAVVFRFRALIPIYIYVMLNGLYAGFSLWWVPYTYIWAILWGMTMLVPTRLPNRAKCVIYPVIAAIHGFAFGILYAPAQALMFHLDWRGMLAWVASGVYFDLIHGISNFAMGFLVFPLSELFKKLLRSARVL